MSARPLVVVGAGPAGSSAAIAAAEAGMAVTLVDENPQVGGQIYRQPPSEFEFDPGQTEDAVQSRGRQLRQQLDQLSERIELLTGTQVWGIFDDRRLAVIRAGCCQFLDAERLVIAAGAYEFVPPFPGWTLPGVWTPGGAQTMAKTMGVLPGRRALVVGTGPFLLVVANHLHQAGVQVVAVVDAVRRSEVIASLPRLATSSCGLLWQGWRYLRRLREAGIPLINGHVIVRADGESELQEAAIAPCDVDWHPDPARVRTFSVDTLCVGYGFVPRIQLAQLAGCRLKYSEELGGWIPEVGEYGESTSPAVWCAGDGAGVAGAAVAELEGTLAGLAAARHAGFLEKAQFTDRTRRILRKLTRLRRFRAALDRLSRVRPGLSSLAENDTVVCRCEELTLAEIKEVIDQGDPTQRALKVATRLGMGPCQGRMCWPGVARCAAALTGRPIEKLGALSVRPPIQPVKLGDLAGPNSPDDKHDS